MLIEAAHSNKNIILMGDLNFEPESEEYNYLIEQGFNDPSTHQETYTNALDLYIYQQDGEIENQILDYILVRPAKNNTIALSVDPYPSYTQDRLDQALSDHHALIGMIGYA